MHAEFLATNGMNLYEWLHLTFGIFVESKDLKQVHFIGEHLCPPWQNYLAKPKTKVSFLGFKVVLFLFLLIFESQ